MKEFFIFVCLSLFVFSTIAADTDVETAPGSQFEGGPNSGDKASLFSAFVRSLSSIVVSELGDKTFFIAAIMAMRYNRIAVLSGALLALFLMTGLSTAFGQIVPALLPASVTHILITVLFFFFGGKLLYDAYNDDGEESNEQAEVEIELNQMHAKLMKDTSSNHHEAQIEYIPVEKASYGKSGDLESESKKIDNCASQIGLVASKTVFWQALTLTFLGEWGDRSQITTIALAAETSATFVFIGAFLGHCLCTSLAVIGGKFLAKRISERTVNICGGVLFLLFGIHNLFMKGE
jgi:putative Ca2+/H+ antiporter (TMEM165/GDT1 family)